MTTESLDELRYRLLREDRVQQMVRARAYEIYRMRGGQPGWESRDWFQAEGEVLAFLLASESRPEDEITDPATTDQVPAREDSPASETPLPGVPRQRAAATGAKPAAAKKTVSKKTASKPESKPKTSRTRKSSKKKDSDR